MGHARRSSLVLNYRNTSRSPDQNKQFVKKNLKSYLLLCFTGSCVIDIIVFFSLGPYKGISHEERFCCDGKHKLRLSVNRFLFEASIFFCSEFVLTIETLIGPAQ